MPGSGLRSLLVTLDPLSVATGGVAVMQDAMIRAHRRLGLEPTLAVISGGADRHTSFRVRELAHGDVKVMRVGYLPLIHYLNNLVPAIVLRDRVRDYDVVQLVSGAHSEALIPILARAPFVSWIATPYLDELESKQRAASPGASVRVNYALRGLNTALERFTLRFPSRVFALSSYTARRLAEITRTSPSRFEVLHQPIDLDLFHPSGEKGDFARGRRYGIVAGRVDDDRKNVASLVRIFAKVAARHPDFDLVAAGMIDAQSAVRDLAARLGVADRVHFVGPLDRRRLAAAYRGADVFLMTSRQEGLGIVVLEAQACGCPTLIMRCGGSDELVRENENGWLIDQGDEDAFASRLERVIDDPDGRARAGREARRGAEAESFDVYTARLADAYRSTFGLDLG